MKWRFLSLLSLWVAFPSAAAPGRPTPASAKPPLEFVAQRGGAYPYDECDSPRRWVTRDLYQCLSGNGRYDMRAVEAFEAAQEFASLRVREIRWVCSADHQERAQALPVRPTIVFPLAGEKHAIRVEMPCNLVTRNVRPFLTTLTTLLRRAHPRTGGLAALVDEVTGVCAEGNATAACRENTAELQRWARFEATQPNARVFHALGVNLVLGLQHSWRDGIAHVSELEEVGLFPELAALKRAKTLNDLQRIYLELRSRFERYSPDCRDNYNDELCQRQLERIEILLWEQGLMIEDGFMKPQTLEDLLKSPARLATSTFFEVVRRGERASLEDYNARCPECVEAHRNSSKHEDWDDSIHQSAVRVFYYREDVDMGGQKIPRMYSDPTLGTAPSCAFDMDCMVRRETLTEMVGSQVVQELLGTGSFGRGICYRVQMISYDGKAPVYSVRETTSDRCTAAGL